MKRVRLWHWVGLRMSLLAIGAVLAIAFAMWVHFTLADRAMLQTIPLPVQAEFQQLRADPQLNQARLWQILSEYYPIDNFLGGLGNSDWLLLWLLVAASIPLILLFGFLFSHPLSRQFSSIAQMARHVAQGDEKAPDELQRLIGDFNSMTTQLQGYEQEVRESSAMIAHELRTPLNAALGRVQGMLDEVFPRDLNQLELVKRQLDQLNKLVDDLHLLSLAKAGQLVLDKTRFNLGQLVHERLSWFNTQLHSASSEPTMDAWDKSSTSSSTTPCVTPPKAANCRSVRSRPAPRSSSRQGHLCSAWRQHSRRQSRRRRRGDPDRDAGLTDLGGVPATMCSHGHFDQLSGGEHDGFVIITADAQGVMVDVHARRPVVLSPGLTPATEVTAYSRARSFRKPRERIEP